MLSERRKLAAARRFFKKAIATNGIPEKVVIDKSAANLAGLQAINTIMKFTETGVMIENRQIKYLNNILEQDHRFIKRITKHMLGFKAFHSAAAIIAGIEVAHMIRKNQFAMTTAPHFKSLRHLQHNCV
ncbi:putative membrane protein [Brucella sp. 10RB9215]|nr:putative membrane protein [Brucella sp. 10RB9215]